MFGIGVQFPWFLRKRNLRSGDPDAVQVKVGPVKVMLLVEALDLLGQNKVVFVSG